MSQAHTPGPWEVTIDSDGDCNIIAPSNTHPTGYMALAQVFAHRNADGRAKRKQALADAFLIAAAPDQNAALLAVHADNGPLWDWVNQQGIGKPEYERRSAVAAQVGAAIVKATGATA